MNKWVSWVLLAGKVVSKDPPHVYEDKLLSLQERANQIFRCLSLSLAILWFHWRNQHTYVCAKLLRLYSTLCNPMDCSPPGSSFHGILQASILEWLPCSSSRGSSQPRNQTVVLTSPALAGKFFTTRATWEALREPEGTPNKNIVFGWIRSAA